MNNYDFIIIGSGIIGASVAYHLILNNPKSKIILLEKEKKPFSHQTSHNSGVIHAGVYYKPGSLKSKFCIEGLKSTYEFCDKNNIYYSRCGKLITASSKDEIPALHSLFDNSNKNDLSLKLLSKHQVKKIEPNLISEEAILSPNTGIIDWTNFAMTMLKKFLDLGGNVKFNYSVTSIDENDTNVIINKKISNELSGSYLISCGGLQSDRLAKMLDLNSNIKIVPFRGDYYLLDEKYNNLFKHLIYPVPNPKLPFLGIHFTKIISNRIILGPNASLNFSRESYSKWILNINDIADYLFFNGFWKLLFNHKEFLFKEFLTSFSKYYYLKQCLKYYQNLEINDLLPYRCGIRAQAVDQNGEPVHDFVFESTSRCLFVLNAPSPAATSSIPIGKYIVKRLSDEFIQ
jgi:L-2-hydroxyglutarate oxidase